MSLEQGHKLAHYEILEPIGKGGMGEVYRAKDGKLGRDVAIKVLPDEFAQDEERLRRFQREAKVLASLNHPNIASIYGVEQSGDTHYLVLELVPGETLAERIARGPIPLEEALEIARKIAEALEEAHEHRIVHRDLKPANVKLTPDDKIKVLDFGLAKAFAEETPEADSSTSPTITRDATRAGVILGTASYMSPEQAKGKPVDTRADIFAFGAVLYEMLTGKRAFPGDDVSEVLASVIKLEPDWEAVPTELPPAGDRLLRRCMTKGLHQRLQHIGDARLDIEEALGAPSTAVSGYRFNAISAGSMIVAVLAAGIALWSLSRPDQTVPRTVTRASISLAVGDEFDSDNTSSVAISPDGLKVSYIARRSNTTQLFLRRVDQLEAERIDGTEGAQTPFFSPDSQWLGFFSRGKIMKVAVSGGAPTIVSEVGGQIRGACWTTADEIIFNPGIGQGLSRVVAAGGEPQPITNPDHERREKTHRLPEPLPGGDKVLFTLASADIDSFDDASIAVLSVETGEYHVVLEGGTHARYSPSGHLVYGRAGSLLAVPFHLETVRVTGSPVPVEDGVSVSTIYGNAHFGISGRGSLIYARGKAVGAERRVVWADREGGERSLIETPGNYESVRISPDGRLLALWVEGANASIWVHDLARTTSTRLTFGFDNYFPVWSPDSRRVAFASTRTIPANVFWQRADGSGEAERFTNSDIIQYPSSWAPDGSVLAVQSETDIDVLSLDGERISEPFLRTRFSEGFSAFSPNGEWIAYHSNESGQNEVYIRPFPASTGKTQVSSGGGSMPRWSSDGEFFYRNGRKMMAVEVDTDGDIRLGEARLLFEKATVTQFYDITPDGDQFAMIVPSESETSATELILVQNWTEELERLAPTN